MTIRILHIATHTHNIGDGALVAGLQATLREDLAQDIEFLPLDVLDLKLNKRRTMLTLQDYRALEQEIDLFLVGGGGMIEGNKGNYRSGINFNFSLRILKAAQRPWVFYALGFNQFPGTHFFHKRRLRRLIQIAHSQYMPFTVRNDGSAERVHKLLPQVPTPKTIPDPGLWVPRGFRQPLEVDPDRLNVIIQLAADRLNRRLKRSPRMIRELASALTRLVEQYNVNLVLAPHLLVDTQLYAQLLHRLPAPIARQSCTMAPVLRGAAHAPDYFEIYRRADLIVGMRGHSLICGIGCGKPVIGLESHAKIGGFLRAINLEEWILNPTMRSLDQALFSLMSQLLREPNEAHRMIHERRVRLREETRAFHKQIGRLI